MITRITIALGAALAATACTDPDPGPGSIELTFDQAVVRATPEGDRVLAEVSAGGTVQATLDWDNLRGQGVLEDLEQLRSEPVSLNGEVTPLSPETVGEMAYRSWIGGGGDASLKYGDCYWVGTAGYGVECCWGNKGWDCIMWY